MSAIRIRDERIAELEVCKCNRFLFLFVVCEHRVAAGKRTFTGGVGDKE